MGEGKIGCMTLEKLCLGPGAILQVQNKWPLLPRLLGLARGWRVGIQGIGRLSSNFGFLLRGRVYRISGGNRMSIQSQKPHSQLTLQLSFANHSPNILSTLATLLGAERGSGFHNLALCFAFHFLTSTLFFLFLKDIGDVFSDVFSDPGSPDAEEPLAGFRTLGTGESHLSYDKATRSKAAAMLG